MSDTFLSEYEVDEDFDYTESFDDQASRHAEELHKQHLKHREEHHKQHMKHREEAHKQNMKVAASRNIFYTPVEDPRIDDHDGDNADTPLPPSTP